MATAQELVWENTFDAPTDLSDWSLHDIDGNSNNWKQGKNWYKDANDNYQTKEGSASVLRFSGSKIDGSYVSGYEAENNWIVSSVIDLTGASGKVELAINWNKINPRSNGIGRVIYISETNDIEWFKSQADVNYDYYISDTDADGNQIIIPSGNDFYEHVLDISTFAGKKIYIGLRSADPQNFEGSYINIDNMAIYADINNLATNEVKAGKSLTKVAQNPVSTSLMLHLNPAMVEAKTTVQVYSAAGQQVLNAKYSREISVAQLAPGMYIAKVSDGTHTETVKFIKK